MFALSSALLLKHVDLRKNPSLEFGMMLVFTYAPYALAEGIHLSGEYYHIMIVVYLICHVYRQQLNRPVTHMIPVCQVQCCVCVY
jgi:hypothetical protein